MIKKYFKEAEVSVKIFTDNVILTSGFNGDYEDREWEADDFGEL